MNQPERILRTLDRHLTRPTRVIIYGRAALALGYHSSPASFYATMDVDAILPESSMAAIEADEGFWEAIQKTNAELEPEGFYMTHLFSDSQVILRPDWEKWILPIQQSEFQFLQLFRPATEDLILSKMMRVDPQDREDVKFLLGQHPLTIDAAKKLIDEARVPDILEIKEAFQINSQWLISLIDAR